MSACEISVAFSVTADRVEDDVAPELGDEVPGRDAQEDGDEREEEEAERQRGRGHERQP